MDDNKKPLLTNQDATDANPQPQPIAGQNDTVTAPVEPLAPSQPGATTPEPAVSVPESPMAPAVPNLDQPAGEAVAPTISTTTAAPEPLGQQTPIEPVVDAGAELDPAPATNLYEAPDATGQEAAAPVAAPTQAEPSVSFTEQTPQTATVPQPASVDEGEDEPGEGGSGTTPPAGGAAPTGDDGGVAASTTAVADTDEPVAGAVSETEGKGAGRYRVRVIPDKCIGAASCVAVAPKAFKLNEQQIAVVLPTINQESDENLLLAAQSCPTMAIEVFDNETGEQVWPK